MKTKKFLVRLLAVIVVLAIGFGLCSLINKLSAPKDVELVSGWQMIQINGIVPKGAVLIVSNDAGTVLPSLLPEDKQATGFISEGRVNFYKSAWVITRIKVWAYFPSGDYEFLVKKTDFLTQCQEKLSDLTGGKAILANEYDVGHQ